MRLWSLKFVLHHCGTLIIGFHCSGGDVGTSGGLSGGHFGGQSITADSYLPAISSGLEASTIISPPGLNLLSENKRHPLRSYKMRFLLEFAGFNIESVHQLLGSCGGRVADLD